VRRDLSRFLSCPIASRFIDTRDDALSYYAHRLAGDHGVSIAGTALTVRFNPEEIHAFTDTRSPCPPQDVVRRRGGREIRCFSRERARLMDRMLEAVAKPAAALSARMPGSVMLFGPADPGARRVCVVLGPDTRDSGVWFVRTAYPVTAEAFVRAKRLHRPAPWPPQ
jgi:hypothetical protein